VAKVRRCKLSWKLSESDQVVGYRLYWSKGNSVDYDSNFFELGNVTEVYLPDILKLNPRYDARIVLGLTALDMYGNESDMVTFATPYQTMAPPAPADLLLTALEEFSVMEATSDGPRKQDSENLSRQEQARVPDSLDNVS
jgi:hypothetical protein